MIKQNILLEMPILELSNDSILKGTHNLPSEEVHWDYTSALLMGVNMSIFLKLLLLTDNDIVYAPLW